jgi:PilZ domain
MAYALATNVRPLRRPAALAPRLRARIPARIKTGPNRASCLLVDISRTGACLSVEGPVDPSAKLWLIVDNLPPIPATPAWHERGRLGVKFEREQEWPRNTNETEQAPAAAVSGGGGQYEAADAWKEF